MAGRKCKLTEEIIQIICENIELGLSYKLTCHAAGISYDSFNDWVRAGEAGDQKFVDFYDRVRASEAECARQSLERIRESARNGTWNAAAWLLERRYPEDYGKKDHLDMKSHMESMNVNIQLSEEEIDAKRSQILKAILGDLETEPAQTDY